MSQYNYNCACCGLYFKVTSTGRKPRKDEIARMVCQLCRDAIKYCMNNCRYDGVEWKRKED